LAHKTGPKWFYRSDNINSSAISGEKKSAGGVAKGKKQNSRRWRERRKQGKGSQRYNSIS
jgi:hypothetical protein